MKSREVDVLEIKNLKPLSKEVLRSEEQKKQRFTKLKRAMLMWNTIHEKSKIIFKAPDGIKSVEASVWFVSDKYVCLYAGITLLVSSIIDVV